MTPDSKYAYVNDYWNGIVYRIELASGTVDQNVNLGAYSNTGIAITPDGSYVYTADYHQHRLSKIDTATHNVSTTIGGMGSPFDIVVHPTGNRVYATDFAGGNLRVAGVASNTLDTTIPGFNSPIGLDATPNGTYVYVANDATNSVSKVDTASNNIVGNIVVGPQTRCVAAGPGNNYIYVSNSGNNTVSMINVATNNVDQTINTGTKPWGVDVSPDGKYLYVANQGDDTVSMINTTTYATEQTFDVGDDPRDCNVSPDGRYVLSANYNGGSVTIIDLNPQAGGGEEPTGPGRDPIPPGGPGNQLGGGGPNGGRPLPPGNTWQPGRGGANHNLNLVVAHTGQQTGQASGAVSREFALPGIMFQRTGPDNDSEECWAALNDSGTMPSGITYVTQVGYNSGAMVADFDTFWPQALLQGLSAGSHHLVYYLMTKDGRKSNYRDEYLVVGGEDQTAKAASRAKTPAVPRSDSELIFKVQVSYFNQATGFVERVRQGMCNVTTESGAWGSFPISGGQLTFTVPFGVTSEVGFNSLTFNGTMTVRMEFRDGFVYCFDQDHRDATVEVYQCVDGESYAIEYYQDLVYICNQGADPDGPILGRMFGK